MTKEKNPGELIIMVVGDVHVDRQDPPSIFTRVAPVLRQGDIVVGNLEGTNSDRGEPLLGKLEVGSGHVRSAPENAKALPAAGFNAMVLANNHNMDYGPEALLQTIEILDGMNIAHAGGGRNSEEAHRPAIVERNGIKVAILSYTSVYPQLGYAAAVDKAGVATVKIHTTYQAPENILYQPGYPPLIITIPDPPEEERMMEDVRKAKEAADIVLVAFHGGVAQGYGRVVGYQKELGRAAIDAGADLIMESHAHQLLGMEVYKHKLICYSLGNFIMDRRTRSTRPHFGWDTIILKCHIEGKQIRKFSFIPVYISDEWQQPYIPQREEGMKVMTKLEALSEEFGTTFTPEGDEVLIGGPKPGTPEARRGLSIEPHRGLSVLADAPLRIPYVMKKPSGT